MVIMDREHSSTGTRAEQARERIAANLTRWADNFWVHVKAGDALVALCDPDGAVAHFETALRMAKEADDFQARADAIPPHPDQPPQGANRPRSTDRAPPARRKRSKSQRKRARAIRGACRNR
jgi:hypothetical protein